MQRAILHLDLDSFFVSVERLKNPSLNGKPVIVGGTSQRGVVSSCSYEARKMGVHSAMSIVKARQLCPDGIFVSGSMSDYSHFSRIVTDIIAHEAPSFEKASIDEFYLDLSGMDKYFGCFKWSIALREKIIRESSLPISFGLSRSKMISKIATGEAKPNGYLMIEEGKEQVFIDPMPVGKLPMVGEKTVNTLNHLGIYTVKQLRQFPLQALVDRFGELGNLLWQKSNAIDNASVENYHEAKSVSAERTFETDTNDKEKLRTIIVALCDKVCFELRQEEKLAAVVAIKMRFENFDTITRQTHIPYTALSKTITNQALSLFEREYDGLRKLRLIGVRVGGLVNTNLQTNLFEDTAEQVKLLKAVDALKEKYGLKSVIPAAGLGLSGSKNYVSKQEIKKEDKRKEP